MLKIKSQTIITTVIFSLPIVFLALFLAGASSSDSASATNTTTSLSFTSTPVLSLSNSAPSLSIQATNPDQFYTASTTLTAGTNNETGYTLTMSDASTTTTDLLNPDYAGTTIPSITSDITIDGTGSNFPTKHWGYSIETSKYKPIPAHSSADQIGFNDTATSGDANIVSFGVKSGSGLAAGIYSSTVTFSLTANPEKAKDITKLTYMQDLADNPGSCAATPEHASKALIDKRDNQTYTVFKAKDGNCWMGENLRFGALPETTPTDTPTGRPWNSTTDPSLTNTTYAGATKMADLTYDSTNPAIAGRIKVSNSGAKTADGASNAFSSAGDNYTEPYIMIYQANKSATYDGKTPYGVIYNYCAVTGGTACTDSSTDYNPTGSICPKGWKLPGMTASATGKDAVTDGSVKTYNNLANSYGYGNTLAGRNGMFSAPINLLRAGYARNGSLYGRSSSGNGYYWSSTKYTSARNAYYLYLSGTSGSYVRQDYYSRYDGYSARCVSESN